VNFEGLAGNGAVWSGSTGNGAELEERKAFPTEVAHGNPRSRQSDNEAVTDAINHMTPH